MTPNESLARRVVDALVAAGLVREADATRLVDQLAKGQVRARDWDRLLEPHGG